MGDDVQACLAMRAAPEVVYDLVSDLPRMGEWSPENQGGEWLDGAKGPAVGARFRGRNRRKLPWTTTSVVTEADRGRTFAFAVGKPEKPDTRWRYTFAGSADGGCEVTETCELNDPGAVWKLLTRFGVGVSWAQRPDDLRRGMEETLQKLKVAAEAAAS